MNTISVGTNLTARAARAAQRIIVQDQVNAGWAGSGRVDARSLSFPARAKSTGTRSSARPVWTRQEPDLRFEKLLLMLLALAAVFGIAYGFSCLLDMVQSWAVMERGMSGLI